MTIQVDFWQAVGLVVTLVGAYAGIVKLVMHQYSQLVELRIKTVGEQIAVVGKQGAAYAEQVTALERELMQLRVDLSRDYVRREDYVQAIATILAKIEAMSLRIENILLKGDRNER